MKAIIAILLSLTAMVGTIQAQDSNKFRQNAAYWEGLDAEEEPYEHDFLHIPDLIDNKTVSFYFNLTHQFLQGVERGMYGNDSLVLDEDCFGPRYVIKINEMAAMIKSDPWRHWMMEIAIVYQLYFMWSD